MRILFITQLFVPEMGALANRMYVFARDLAAAGNEVSVVTGMPNYPRGVVPEEYRGKMFSKEDRDGYTVLRSAYITVPRNKSRWPQLFSYLSFLPGALWNSLKAGKVDVVFVTSPPIFPALVALLVAALRRAKLIFDVRDLWPDEIVVYGGAGEHSPGVRFLHMLERFIYQRSDRISCTTDSIADAVCQRGGRREKILQLPNGADLDLFRPVSADNDVVREFDLAGRFVVMYCGAFGIKHGLNSILEAAELLQEEEGIRFLFVGAGGRDGDLEECIRTMRLRNVIFVGERKLEELPLLLARADVCVSSHCPAAYADKIVAVKVFEYLACGKPVIGLHTGETARVIQESGAGIVLKPADSHGLAEAIRALYRNPDLLSVLASRSRAYVEKQFSRQAVALKLRETAAGLLRRPAPVPVGVVTEGNLAVVSDTAPMADKQRAA